MLNIRSKNIVAYSMSVVLKQKFGKLFDRVKEFDNFYYFYTLLKFHLFKNLIAYF